MFDVDLLTVYAIVVFSGKLIYLQSCPSVLDCAKMLNLSPEINIHIVAGKKEKILCVHWKIGCGIQSA